MTADDVAAQMLDRLQHPSRGGRIPLVIRTVRSGDELKTATRLVYVQDERIGTAATNTAGLRLSLHHALPSTRTLIACRPPHGILATLTVVADSPIGLPMDDQFKGLLDGLRRQRVVLAELAWLAVDRAGLAAQVGWWRAGTLAWWVALRLVAAAYEQAHALGAERVVTSLAPLPRGSARIFALTPIALSLRPGLGARSRPVARNHALTGAEIQPTAWARMLHRTNRPSPADLTPPPALSAHDLRWLFVMYSTVFASASPTELAYLKHCYATYNFSEILRSVSPLNHPSESEPNTP